VTPTIQRLEDIEAIKQLKARCCRFIDTKDWDGYRALLAEDFHLARDGGVHDGREQVLAYVSTALASATTVHHVHTPEITITGTESATAIWPMNDYVEIPVDESSFVLRGYGHYHEDYVRTEEGWRVKSSELIRLRVDTGT
jgi:hypothetical protein